MSVPKTGDFLKISLQNQQQIDANNMSVDLYVQNTGTNDMHLNSIQFGILINQEILNGGTLSCAYSPNTSDIPIVANTFMFQGYVCPPKTTFYELKNTSNPGSINSSNAPELPIGTLIKVGTFIITNTAPFTSGSTTAFTLDTLTPAGHENTGVMVYDANNTIASVPLNNATYRSVETDGNLTFA